jgi:hypothetical protein
VYRGSCDGAVGATHASLASRCVTQRRLIDGDVFSPSAIAEGRRKIQAAVGASAPVASPFSQTQKFNKYGGRDIIAAVLELRDRALEEQAEGPDGDDAFDDDDGTA